MSNSIEASRLYHLSASTEDGLHRFRLDTSRVKTAQAKIYYIDKKDNRSILPDQRGGTYTSLEDIADALPENNARFVFLSYPCVLEKSGRQASPYVMLFYMPPGAGSEERMMYASAKEFVRGRAQASRVYEVSDEWEVTEVGKAVIADLER